MKLPTSIVELLYSTVYLPAFERPYHHLDGYMLRHWVLGDRSPERNADNPQWHGRRGGWLYRLLTRCVAIRAHTILRSDHDRALHDHPWWSISIVLKGGYWEVGEPNGACIDAPEMYELVLRELPWFDRRKPLAHQVARRYNIRWRGPGSVVLRRACSAHRLVLPHCDGTLHAPTAARTLFIMGPKCHDWGFYPEPFRRGHKVPWRQYLGLPPGGADGGSA